MKNLKSIIMIVAVILIWSLPVYAHKMTIDPERDGVIKVYYDDGSFSSKIEITVYDSNDEIIESGKLDDQGKYSYDINGGAAYIVADDGMGHKDEWKIGEKVKINTGGSKVFKIGAVVLVLALLAGISYWRKGKKA